MIDKARVEEIHRTTWSSQWYPTVTKIPTDELHALATDDLALRAIVEALAAKNPIEWDEIEALDGRPGYRCRYCGSLNPSDDPESFIHIVTCEWARARALIVPASERTEG